MQVVEYIKSEWDRAAEGEAGAEGEGAEGEATQETAGV